MRRPHRARRLAGRRLPGKITLVLAWALVLVVVPSGVAHISVVPAEAEVGSETPFVVRIPNETGAAMTTARVTFPSGVQVPGPFRAPSGWRANSLGSTSGDLDGVDYTGSLAPGEQLEVTVIGTPLKPGTAVWRVAQTFDDGRQVLWTGNPDPSAVEEPGEGEVGPAAAVTITAASLDPAPPDAGAEPPSAAADEGTGTPESSSTSAWIAVIAAVFALMALAGAGWMWSNRPMDLPDDDA